MTSQLYIAEQTCLKNAVLPDFSEHQVDILIFKITIFLQNIFIKKQNRSIGLAVSFSECIAYTFSQTELLPCFPKCARPPRSEALTEGCWTTETPSPREYAASHISGRHNVPSQPESVAEAWTHCFIVSSKHSPSTQWGLPLSSHSPETRSGDKKFQELFQELFLWTDASFPASCWPQPAIRSQTNSKAQNIPLFKLNRKLHIYLSYTFPLLSASSWEMI